MVKCKQLLFIRPIFAHVSIDQQAIFAVVAGADIHLQQGNTPIMKLFSLKKDAGNQTETTTQGTTEVYEPVNHADTASLDVAKDPMDAFSLDALDLDALNIEGNELQADTTTQPAKDGFNFDDFDFDSLNLDGTVSTPTANQPQPLAQDDLAQADIMSALDDLDLGTSTTHNDPVSPSNDFDNAFDNNDSGLDNSTLPTDHNPQADMALGMAGVAGAAALASDNPTNRPIPPLHDEQPVKPPKKGLFGRGKGDKPAKLPVGKTTITKTTTHTKPMTGAKKPNKLLLGLIPLALLVLGGLYFLMQDNEEPAPTPVPVAKPKPAVVAPVASVPATASVAITNASLASATASTSMATASVASTAIASASSPTIAPINTIAPEEILKPDVPTDPAVAKEEVDRLAEQSNQLKEQEKMIEEQLAMMNELSSKKEERIKLLEQQVAQLEQQKAAEKAGKATTAKP